VSDGDTTEHAAAKSNEEFNKLSALIHERLGKGIEIQTESFSFQNAAGRMPSIERQFAVKLATVDVPALTRPWTTLGELQIPTTLLYSSSAEGKARIEAANNRATAS